MGGAALKEIKIRVTHRQSPRPHPEGFRRAGQVRGQRLKSPSIPPGREACRSLGSLLPLDCSHPWAPSAVDSLSRTHVSSPGR